MNVSCPQCSTTYRVDPARVPPGGVRARCSACGGVIPVGTAELATRPTSRTAWPSMATPSAPAPAVPSGSTGSAARATTPRVARPFIPSQAPTSVPVSVPTFTPPAPAPVTPKPPAQPAPAATSRATYDAPVSIAPVTPPAPGERRPINPFLARDPSLRAKRLARALVSDMVAYYPAKHSEGLQRGTLKELFREEIKKSYEEYVAQVGADFARGTTLFQEALNEVLGAGKRIF